MPAPVSNDELFALIAKSGVLDAARVNAYLDKLAAADGVPADPAKLGGLMVRDGVLTHFQAEQLLQGRWKRFSIGKYKVLERLGVGGMGQVFLCEHKLMKRKVAVKVLPAAKSKDEAALQRFYREARAVAALNHPNIVHAYDIDKFDGVHFLVMEYVDGSSLQDVIARYAGRKRHFDPVRAAHYVAQAAAGLQHAAALGLIHRDIKPGNLLLDRSGIVKVLDLGLARFFDHRHDGLTERFDDKCVLGTADYLAPEQVTNDKVDIRADIYGLGGTLYFLLTGSSPFPDGTVAQKLVAAQTQKPKAVATFRPDVPAALVAVAERMMAKNPADRYQTMGEVLDALAPWTALPIPRPSDKEMPDLSPAVMERMTANPLPGRSSSHLILAHGQGSKSGGSAVRIHPADPTQAGVPTRRPVDTLPTRPASKPAEIPPAPEPRPVVVRPKGYVVSLLFALGGLWFLMAAVIFWLAVGMLK